MAAVLPAKLKIPSIAPFATRGAQLEKFKPIVSYWCDYYIINQILSKGLHTVDDDCMAYTETLMEKLEQVKSAQPDNDAITDDLAAKAYIEQFALDTFQRGDDAIHTNKASRQTIDTFQAAATFLELLTTWAPLDSETAAKVKYAKYHAIRIAKAIKAGEDPNATNPVHEEPSIANELADLERAGSQTVSDVYRPPTVESAPESKQPTRPGSIVQSTPFAPPPPETVSGLTPDAGSEHGASLVDTAEDASRPGSIGGGYFPQVPTFTSETSVPHLPTTDVGAPSSLTQSDLRSPAPQDFYSQPLDHPSPPVRASAPVPFRAPIAHAPAPTGGYRSDDDSVAAAQKHAKWAMSALNFEDVDTAVKELRLALQSLGAV